MIKGKPLILGASAFTLLLGASAFTLLSASVALVSSQDTAAPSVNKPVQAVVQVALNVAVVQASQRDMVQLLSANGSIAAWQEAIIGAQVSDLRLDEVRVQVGENVRKGQLLAVFNKDKVLVDIAQHKAAVAEAQANLAEARLNAARAKDAAPSGVLSMQQIEQYLTLAKTAQAKLDSAKALLDSQLLRLNHTQVVAIDDGVIASRSATLGAVAIPGQELFRLIRQNRLEWRAEVTAAEMVRLKPGIAVVISVPNVGQINGKVRFLAPTLDTQSRTGLVYVELLHAADAGLRAGMFAQGQFQLGHKRAWTLPQDALSLREGFSYVFRLGQLAQNKSKVTQVKVQLGQRSGDSYEILSGLTPEDKVVASGAAFLADGDNVKVVQP